MKFQVTDRAMPSGSKRVMTEHGYMLIKDCAISRAGVTEYAAANFQPRAYTDRDPNDVIRVYRSEATLAASAPLWQGSPVANDHPPEFFNADNTPKYQKGSAVGYPTMKGPLLVVDLLVTDTRTIGDIEAGKSELSNGYYSGYDFKPGLSPAGEAYDCEQLDLRPNHIAVVAAGRCGSICKVSDSLDEIIPEKPTMATVTVGGITYEASEQLVQVVSNLQTQLSGTATKIANADSALATAADQLVAAEAKVTALTAQLTAVADPSSLDAAVEERVATLDVAGKIIANYDGKGKTNAAIRREIVAAKCPDVAVKNLDSADYVTARFEALAVAPAAAGSPDALAAALQVSLQNKDAADKDLPNVDAARTAAIARRAVAYKGKA